ncbi:hypothetical protein L204_103453 [Cryptococcus depauperatus]
MPPTSLAALMASPATSSGDATAMANGQTLPDISLGSMGSSFRSEEDHENDNNHMQEGPDAGLPKPSSRAPSFKEKAQSSPPSTPSPPRAALLTVSPPATVRRSSSHLGHSSQAPRRSRVLQRQTSNSSIGSEDISASLEERYGQGEETDDEAILSALSLASPKKAQPKEKYSGPSARSGRHSVAAGELNGPITLRDQEKHLEETKKEVFNLQLENHFLKERLSNMAPEHIEAALKENVKLKLEILTLSKELKKLKKLVTQQDRDLAAATREKGEGLEVRELERLWKEEKEKRRAAESDLKHLERLAKGEEEGELEEVRASETAWRQRAEQLEEDLNDARANQDDQNELIEKLRDVADRGQEDVEQLKADLEELRSKVVRESVGIGKGREERLAKKVEELEQENASLQADLSMVKKGIMSEEDAELLEERLNELQDKLAAAQIELDNRQQEIDELNAELDAQVQEHEKELQQVAEEWRNEVLETRAQVDELKDSLDVREQENKDIRDMLAEREDNLASALQNIQDLQAERAEAHDRLEETLKNIERDNAAKDEELLASNHDLEEYGQRVFELEEALEEYRLKERDLIADLEALETEKRHYEELVGALKQARRGLQEEKNAALDQVQKGKEALKLAQDSSKQEIATEQSKHNQALSEKDTFISRLQAELGVARERVALRDRDLAELERKFKDVENERRKLGDEHTSNKYGLELVIERVQRDLQRCEDELEIAKKELEKAHEDLRERDIEVARMLDKHREVENRLASERQGRLNISDKLDQTIKTSKQYEREANLLRERIEELEPLLTETQQERFQLQKQSESQRQERSELLLRVFKDVSRFVGTEDITTPANFNLFRDILLQRLKSMIAIRTEFERKIRDTEISVDQRMASLKRQLEQKWRMLDQFEAAVKKLELTKREWRSKFAMKEGEIDALKHRNADLSLQIASIKTSSAGESSTQIRSLTERALAAETRAQKASNQVVALEERLAEYQNKVGQAENKWEARVKEYENRLRVASEKIKTEKQGGKERAKQLEAQVRELEKQISSTRARDQRVEGMLANATHHLPIHGDDRGSR